MMIHKLDGSFNINKLHVIHLFEADYNGLNDLVICLSISLSAIRSVALSILFGCSAASRWDMLYCLQLFFKCLRNNVDCVELLDVTPLYGAIFRGSWLPKRVC